MQHQKRMDTQECEQRQEETQKNMQIFLKHSTTFCALNCIFFGFPSVNIPLVNVKCTSTKVIK